MFCRPPVMRTRVQLAAIDYSKHKGREYRRTKDGKIRWARSIESGCSWVDEMRVEFIFMKHLNLIWKQFVCIAMTKSIPITVQLQKTLQQAGSRMATSGNKSSKDIWLYPWNAGIDHRKKVEGYSSHEEETSSSSRWSEAHQPDNSCCGSTTDGATARATQVQNGG